MDTAFDEIRHHISEPGNIVVFTLINPITWSYPITAMIHKPWRCTHISLLGSVATVFLQLLPRTPPPYPFTTSLPPLRRLKSTPPSHPFTNSLPPSASTSFPYHTSIPLGISLSQCPRICGYLQPSMSSSFHHTVSSGTPLSLTPTLLLSSSPQSHPHSSSLIVPLAYSFHLCQ